MRIKAQRAKEQTLTSISWPDLPDEDEPDGTHVDHHGEQNNAIGAIGATKSLRSVAPPLTQQGGRNGNLPKKPSMSSILSPPKQSKNHAHASMADRFPKASKDTKDFIRDLEVMELRVRHMKSSKKATLEAGATRKLKPVNVPKKKKKGGKKPLKDSQSMGLMDMNDTGFQQGQGDDTGILLDNWGMDDGGFGSLPANNQESFNRPGTSAQGSRGQRAGGTPDDGSNGGNGQATGAQRRNQEMSLDENYEQEFDD